MIISVRSAGFLPDHSDVPIGSSVKRTHGRRGNRLSGESVGWRSKVNSAGEAGHAITEPRSSNA